MKYNIMGFQQKGLLNSKIDGNDLILLDYLCYQLLNSSLEKVLIDDKAYVWIKNEMILEDLPFLNLQERSLYYRLEKLVKENFIERKTKYTEDKIKKTYTAITQKAYNLKFENKNIEDLKIKVVDNSKNAQNQQVAEATSSFQETNALKEEIKCLKKELEMLKDNNKEINKEIPYFEIVNYLNKKLGTHYRENNDKTQKHINARWNEGYRLDDFKKVIDNKCSEWLNTDMEQYLRPETLFGTKFESYLNAKIIKNRNVDKTTPHGWQGTFVDDEIEEF